MTRKFSIVVVCLVLLAGISLTPPVAVADGSPVLSRIVESGEFRVGTSGKQPPYSIKSKDGSLIGYEIALAGLLADAMGVELKLIEKPFPKLLAALEKGEVDAVMSGMSMTPERNLKAAFVGPYVISGKSVLTKEGNLAEADEVIDLDKTTVSIAALAKSTSERFVKVLIPNANLTLVQDYDEAIKLLLEDKVKAVVADFEICALSILRYPDQGLATLVEPLTIEPIGIALPPGDALMVNMVENYLSALDAVGVLERLELQWFDDASWLLLVP